MPPTRTPMRRTALAATAALAVSFAMLAPAHAAEPVPEASTTFYVDPHSTTLEAAQTLSGQARADAQLLGSVPSASWFTGGTPQEVRAEVDGLVGAASKAGQL